MRGNIKSFEKPFTHAEVVALAARTLKRFGDDRNKAGRYARSMENRYESAKWAQVVEVIATSGRHHSTMKTAPAQLDREIAEALATPKHEAASVPKIASPAPPRRPKKRVTVVWADLNVLAQAASFGDISVDDLAPSARTTARVSKTWRERTRAAGARLRGLAERGLLEEGYGDKYTLTETGRQVLVDAGYAPTATGTWIKPGARRPSWSW